MTQADSKQSKVNGLRHNLLMHLLIVFLFIFTVDGCTTRPEVKPAEVAKLPQKAPVLNWVNPKEVTFLLDEYSIMQSGADAPSLELMAGQFYKLNIKNEGRKFHIFDAVSFFRTVALAKIGFGKNTEVETPGIGSIKVGAGQNVTLFLIPIKTGVYEVICSLTLHLNAGMRSRIVVRDKPAEK